jgi:hypothetical protein
MARIKFDYAIVYCILYLNSDVFGMVVELGVAGHCD